MNYLKGSASVLHQALSFFKIQFYNIVIGKFFSVPNKNPAITSYSDIVFNLNNKEVFIEKYQLNIVTALSGIGGLISLITFICDFIIERYRLFVFYQKIIKSTFMTQNQNQGKKVSSAKRRQEIEEFFESENKSKDPKRLLRIFNSLNSRKGFNYTFYEALKRAFGCKTSKYRAELFKHAQNKINQALDIKLLIKEMRQLKIFMNMSISKS